jgi:hypothetical protein
MYPGRGVVTTGYGKVALPPESKKPAPVEHPKPAAPTRPATRQEIEAAMRDLLAEMKRNAGGYGPDIDGPYVEDKRSYFSMRHWGHWENPRDQEDEEDYDWQELSDESSTLLTAILAKLMAKYPNVKLSVTGSEKNWLEGEAESQL